MAVFHITLFVGVSFVPNRNHLFILPIPPTKVQSPSSGGISRPDSSFEHGTACETAKWWPFDEWKLVRIKAQDVFCWCKPVSGLRHERASSTETVSVSVMLSCFQFLQNVWILNCSQAKPFLRGWVFLGLIVNMTTVDTPVTKRNTNIVQGIMQRALRDQRTQEIMYEVCWLKVTNRLILALWAMASWTIYYELFIMCCSNMS